MSGSILGGVTINEINGFASGVGLGDNLTGTCSRQYRGLEDEWRGSRLGFAELFVSSLA